MPAFHLKCDKCSKEKRKLLPKYEVLSCDCGGFFHRNSSDGPNTVIKETLDNGVMVRKVERIHNIDQLIKERAQEPDKDDFI
jgi:hypothetical protein